MKNAREFSWDEYFSIPDKYDKIKNGTSLFDTSSLYNYYIYLCIFKECKETGALHIERNNEIYTLLEETIFNNCSSILSSGTVFYLCQEEGQFVQHKTCYYKSITETGRLAFTQIVNYSPSHKNYAIEVSVFECGENEENGFMTFIVGNGDIHFENNNITNNKCRRCSSVIIQLDGSTGTCNFSNFRDNNQTESWSLVFLKSDPNSLTQTISYCNIIGNKCKIDDEQVLFYCQLNVNVDHCIFLNNTAVIMFEHDVESYTLTISESYIESNSTTGEGSITFNNLVQNYDFNTFTYYLTENCIINSEKLMSLKVSYLSKFSKTATAGLLPSKK